MNFVFDFLNDFVKLLILKHAYTAIGKYLRVSEQICSSKRGLILLNSDEFPIISL